MKVPLHLMPRIEGGGAKGKDFIDASEGQPNENFFKHNSQFLPKGAESSESATAITHQCIRTVEPVNNAIPILLLRHSF